MGHRQCSFSLQHLLTARCPLHRNYELVNMSHPITEQGLAVARLQGVAGKRRSAGWGPLRPDGGRRKEQNTLHLLHTYYLPFQCAPLSVRCIRTESLLSAGQPGKFREGCHPPPPPPPPRVKLLTLGHTAESGVELGSVSRPFCFGSPGIAF